MLNAPFNVADSRDGATTTEFSANPAPNITNSPTLSFPEQWALNTTIPELYHTDTFPISFKLSAEQIAQYETNPTKLVGQMYLPGKGENLWEVIEVSFDKTGWSTMAIRVEGKEAKHKLLLKDFFGMLKCGVLQGVEF